MAVNNGDTDTIDVEHLTSSIQVTMSQYGLFMPPKRCIFKTPIALYRHNNKAYIPDAFSIGPLHHGRPNCPNFEATETIKAKYLQGFISRFQNPILKDLINSVSALEREAREYYAGPIDYSREEFVKILVIDGCFMIELFCRNASMKLREEKDPIFGMSTMNEFLAHDLILLENQLPWMVLDHLFKKLENQLPLMDPDHLFNMSPDGRKTAKTLIHLAIEFFGSIFILPPTDRPDLVRDIQHIPDLFKKWLVSSIKVDQDHMPYATLLDMGENKYSSIEGDEEENSRLESGQHVPTAKRLMEAGIKFRMSESKNMFDIRFTNGVLEIPQIKIHEITETFLRNLISFEQCYPNSDTRITSYAILLDNLITTAKDVEILSENKIIDNWLNPEDAAKFFNKLYHDTYVETHYYGKLCREVNKYCEKTWNRCRAVLVGKYFNTPWAGLSSSAAVILLILNFVQSWDTITS